MSERMKDSNDKQVIRAQQFVRDLNRILDERLPRTISQKEQLRRRLEKRTFGRPLAAKVAKETK